MRGLCWGFARCELSRNNDLSSALYLGIGNLRARSLSNKGPEEHDGVKEYRIEMSFSINVKHKRRPRASRRLASFRSSRRRRRRASRSRSEIYSHVHN